MRYFRNVPHHHNILISALPPSLILHDALEQKIDNVLVFPTYSECLPAEFSDHFDYLTIMGTECATGWSLGYFQRTMREAVQWLSRKALHGRTLLVDESGGRGGAALVLLAFLYLQGLYDFPSALQAVETCIRGEIHVHPIFIGWTKALLLDAVVIPVDEPASHMGWVSLKRNAIENK